MYLRVGHRVPRRRFPASFVQNLHPGRPVDISARNPARVHFLYFEHDFDLIPPDFDAEESRDLLTPTQKAAKTEPNLPLFDNAQRHHQKRVRQD